MGRWRSGAGNVARGGCRGILGPRGGHFASRYRFVYARRVPLYVLIGRDGPRGAALRRAHREAHLRNLEPLARSGRVRFAGPLRDAAGDPRGSVVVFEATDLDAARSVAAGDPYVLEGVFESHEVFETAQVFPT